MRSLGCFRAVLLAAVTITSNLHAEVAEDAAMILEKSGVTGGFVVCLGASDGNAF